LQQLKPPVEMFELMDIYTYCGHKLDDLEPLRQQLTEHKAEREGECRGLRLVLAAAKQTEDVEVRLLASLPQYNLCYHMVEEAPPACDKM
jgi:hypothetical protein